VALLPPTAVRLLNRAARAVAAARRDVVSLGQASVDGNVVIRLWKCLSLYRLFQGAVRTAEMASSLRWLSIDSLPVVLTGRCFVAAVLWRFPVFAERSGAQ